VPQLNRETDVDFCYAALRGQNPFCWPSALARILWVAATANTATLAALSINHPTGEGMIRNCQRRTQRHAYANVTQIVLLASAAALKTVYMLDS
jgi:hypothetical protein